MDQQRWMDILVGCNGSSVLNTVLGNFSNYDSDDDTFQQTLSELLKKKITEIGQPKGTYVPKPNSFLKPDPLKEMPPELYRKCCSKMQRRQLFFKHLKRRDILYLQVLNTNDKESYKCLVLAKHGDVSQVDDLSIVAHFPKLRPELDNIRGYLCKFDLIRGAIWSCSAWDRKMFVTLDTQIFSEEELEKIPKLGRISRLDLPHYVRFRKIGMTYAGYVLRSKGYREGSSMEQLPKSLGVDDYDLYSFFGTWNGKTFHTSKSYGEVKKNVVIDETTKCLLESFEYFRVGNMFQALKYANMAVASNPGHTQARLTRGTVYANLGKMKYAFIDTIDCLKLDSKCELACKQMAELLVAVSKSLLRKQNYTKWHELLVMAKKYNPKNSEVEELLSCARYETNFGGYRHILEPRVEKVTAIYNRIFNEEEKKRRIKQYKKMCKRHKREKRRRKRHAIRVARAARRKARQQAISAQPIPTTTTTRRQVYFRPGSPVFRRPYPPRIVNMRP